MARHADAEFVALHAEPLARKDVARHDADPRRIGQADIRKQTGQPGLMLGEIEEREHELAL